jgi:hypothetical protein
VRAGPVGVSAELEGDDLAQPGTHVVGALRVTQPALRDLKKTIEKIAITTANLFFLLLYHD